ncbi:MAG: DUF167 domain-containing protein [Gaiellales bacterium]
MATGGGKPVRLRIRVSPGARGSELVGRHGDGWKLRVAAPPERGRANEAVVVLLAETLGVPRQAVRVVAGQTGRDKVIEVDGIANEDAERRLAARGRKGDG